MSRKITVPIATLSAPYAMSLDEWAGVVEVFYSTAEMIAATADETNIPNVGRNIAAILAQLADALQENLPIDQWPVDTDDDYEG